MGGINKEKFTASLDSRHTVMFAHIFDMAQICEKRFSSVYGDFLSENSISTLLCRKQFLPMEPMASRSWRVAEISKKDGEENC